MRRTCRRALGDAGKESGAVRDQLRHRQGHAAGGFESRPLKEIAKLLTTEPEFEHMQVVGHSDNQGKPDYNLDLSRRRAAVGGARTEHEIRGRGDPAGLLRVRFVRAGGF